MEYFVLVPCVMIRPLRYGEGLGNVDFMKFNPFTLESIICYSHTFENNLGIN